MGSETFHIVCIKKILKICKSSIFPSEGINFDVSITFISGGPVINLLLWVALRQGWLFLQFLKKGVVEFTKNMQISAKFYFSKNVDPRVSDCISTTRECQSWSWTVPSLRSHHSMSTFYKYLCLPFSSAILSFSFGSWWWDHYIH